MDGLLIPFIIAILIFSAVMHEVSHGAMAYALGDPTAKMQGRLTMNPLVHLDMYGSVILPTLMVILQVPFLFAYAKPVPYNPYNLKYLRWGESLVAVAGPLSNIILALLLGLIFQVAQYFNFINSSELFYLFLYAIRINILLAVFNLVPIPPLDGSKVIRPLLPYNWVRSTFYIRLEQQGMMLLLVVLFLGGFQLLEPIINGVTQIILGI